MYILNLIRSASAVFVLTLLLSCATAGDPGTTGTRGPSPSAEYETPPVYALLGQRERLELTSEQIATLDSIGTWIDSANNASRATLRVEGVSIAADTAITARSPLSTTSRSALLAIAENNAAALAGVRGTLTEEQRSGVCELFDPHRGQTRDDRRQRRRSAISGYRWPWCNPTDEVARLTSSIAENR